jgi:hypothetical protein
MLHLLQNEHKTAIYKSSKNDSKRGTLGPTCCVFEPPATSADARLI